MPNEYAGIYSFIDGAEEVVLVFPGEVPIGSTHPRVQGIDTCKIDSAWIMQNIPGTYRVHDSKDWPKLKEGQTVVDAQPSKDTVIFLTLLFDTMLKHRPTSKKQFVDMAEQLKATGTYQYPHTTKKYVGLQVTLNRYCGLVISVKTEFNHKYYDKPVAGRDVLQFHKGKLTLRSYFAGCSIGLPA